jgi:hypothetical protein
MNQPATHNEATAEYAIIVELVRSNFDAGIDRATALRQLLGLAAADRAGMVRAAVELVYGADADPIGYCLPDATPATKAVVQELLDAGAIDSPASVLSLTDGSVRPNAWGGFDLEVDGFKTTRLVWEDQDAVIYVFLGGAAMLLEGTMRLAGCFAQPEDIASAICNATGFHA